MAAVSKRKAQIPLILALDIGTSATRGRIFDAAATGINKLVYRVRHDMHSAEDGTNTTDADQMLAEIVASIDFLTDKAGKYAHDLAGVALDTFAATLVGVSEQGDAVTPVFTYADSRAAPFVTRLEETFDEHAVQQRTGCRFHASYLPARFLWLQETQPEVLAKAAYWMSLGEYVYFKLLGQRAASFSTAAWSGLLNRETLTWDAELLGGLPIKIEQLSALHDTSAPLRGLAPVYAKRWPSLTDAAWFPAIADGYASNVGSGATASSTLALAVGTSAAARALVQKAPATVPDGLWCYAVNRRQSLLGGAVNDGGRALTWLRGLLSLSDDQKVLDAIQAAPAADTPVVMPFLTGERSPGWASHATASFSGMDLHSTPESIFRGMLEGIAFRLALIAEEIRSAGLKSTRIVASGGGVEGAPDWLQIIADMTGLPAALSLEPQATLRGTAEIALDVLAPKTKRSPAEMTEARKPVPANAAAYAAKRERFLSDYKALVTERQPAPAPDSIEQTAAKPG
jgi:gluconokinase